MTSAKNVADVKKPISTNPTDVAGDPVEEGNIVASRTTGKTKQAINDAIAKEQAEPKDDYQDIDEEAQDSEPVVFKPAEGVVTFDPKGSKQDTYLTIFEGLLAVSSGQTHIEREEARAAVTKAIRSLKGEKVK